jgi:uncharacterized protein (UPF0332 family)
VKSESQAYLDKARLCIVKARVELASAASEPLIAEDAGRNAYYAAFHAAQALIFERTGKVSKTHGGVHRLFHRLIQNEPTISGKLRSFIISAYDLKSIADYDTAAVGKVTPARASEAIATAEQLLAAIVAVLPP